MDIVLWGAIIVFVLICAGLVLYALMTLRRYKNHKETYQDIFLNDFNSILLDQNLHVRKIIKKHAQTMLGITVDDLVGVDIQQLEGLVSPQNKVQARFIIENIQSVKNEKKNRHFEYASFNEQNDTVSFAICFLHYYQNGTISAYFTAVKESNILQARQNLYNTDLNPAIGFVSVGVYVRSVGREKVYDMFNLQTQYFFGTKDVVDSPNWNQKEEDRYDDMLLITDGSIVFEKPMLDDKGNIHQWLQVVKRKKPKLDSEGYFITTTLLDITSHKLKEADLEELRRNLEMAINAADISIWIYRQDNGLFYTLYGQETFMSEKTYDGLLSSLSESSSQEFKCAFDRLMNGKSQKELMIGTVWNNQGQSETYYEFKMTASQFDDRGSVKEIVGTIKDITYQYNHKKQLEEERQKVDMAIQISDLVQWEYNNTTRLFKSVNERIKNKETELTCDDYFNAVHPDDRESVGEIIAHMNKGVDAPFLFNKRLKYYDEDSWHYTTVSGAPFEKDHLGRVIKYTGFRRDDTQWKEANDRLEQEKEKAQEADKLKSAFLANMSHEIRTPLNAIVGFSQLLQMTDDPAEKSEYVHIINVNNELLLRLIGDILDLSKIESGMFEFKKELFDVAPFFEDFVTTIRQRITNPRVELISETPYRRCVMRLDSNRLAQVLSNFATNAIKYTSEGSIKIEYTYTDGGLRFSVQDTGIGIPKDKQGKIFRRFEKLDDFAQGTGLGLSISKAIIDNLKGKIGFESQAGEGSTFWAWIPGEADLDDGSSHEEVEEEYPVKIEREISSDVLKNIWLRKTVLVAEDKDSNFLLLKSMLKGINLIRARDGVEAVEMASENQYSLILMDLRMPRMSGLEATRKIREFNKKTPIIAVTANAFDSDRVDALDAGCNDFVAKPIKKEDLFRSMDNLILKK